MSGTERTLAPAPTWIPRRERGTPNAELQAASLEDVRAALAVIPNDHADWDWWSRVAGAVHNASGGGDEAFALFDGWSQQCPVYDEQETRAKWQQVSRSPYRDVGMGTLFHLATQADPNWQKPSRIAAAFAPDATQAPAGLALTSPPDLRTVAVPAREWILQDWIPYGSTTALYGDGGTGKSLLALQLQTCLAAGRPFLDMPAAPVRSLGVYCEDTSDELHRRLIGIGNALGIGFGDLGAMAWTSRVGGDNLLMRFADGVGTLTSLWHQVRDAAERTRTKLVVLDTAADLYGGNENDRGQVRQFVQGACTRLAVEIGGAVLLLAHPSRSGLATGTGDSGSTGWSAAVRSRLYFERADDDTNARILSRKKSNYAAAGGAVRVRYQAGAFMVLGGEDAQEQEAAADVTFLRLLDGMNAAGRPVSHKERAANYAPKAFAKHPDRDGFKRTDFEAAMERLFHTGKIRTENYKDASRRFMERIACV